ncbi:MAG: hypothetical protein QW587_03570 [Candidatus Bathyarchaeia archaeon]
MNYNVFSHRQAEEILKSKLATYNAIKNLITGLPPNADHTAIKNAFKKMNWETEVRPSERELQKKWRYDAFRDMVAVEIDTGGTPYRSLLKFVLGYNEGKIHVGVTLCRHSELKLRQRELEDLHVILPVPILVVGIY